MGSRRTRIPDLDRPVTRSRHDLGPVRGKGDREYSTRVGLLRYMIDEHRDHPANKREEERLRRRVYSAAWRYGTTSGCKLEGRLKGLDADSNSQQRAARIRGIACGVWLRSSWRTESRMPLKKAAQLGVSGLGRHVAVKRAGAEKREARDCGKAREKAHGRE